MKKSFIVIGIAVLLFSCTTGKQEKTEKVEVLRTNIGKSGTEMEIRFLKGKSHNHPLMAIWIEDEDGNFLETLYIAESIGKGIFEYGQEDKGKWKPGPIDRPAALPYWAHKRGVKNPYGSYNPWPEKPVIDAITGPTPQGSFSLSTRTQLAIPSKLRVLFEINQSWDWNEYWTNDKYPDDEEYKTSSQPAIIYAADIDLSKAQYAYTLKPIGHSHYSGKNGNIFTDLSVMSTALNITKSISISFPHKERLDQ